MGEGDSVGRHQAGVSSFGSFYVRLFLFHLETLETRVSGDYLRAQGALVSVEDAFAAARVDQRTATNPTEPFVIA